eukprot:723450-Prorocentrum_minimum.AAC.1
MTARLSVAGGGCAPGPIGAGGDDNPPIGEGPIGEGPIGGGGQRFSVHRQRKSARVGNYQKC